MIKSVYIHIPFCRNICSYCDFCKVYKNKEWINKYLKELKKEINKNYKGETINTLYIGGGTPSCLNIDQLNTLFNILKIFKLNNAEITLEANCEDLTKEKLEFLKDKINRLSIGVQTFNKKHLKVLERKVNINNILLAKKYFKNINIDLMYNLPNQTQKELEEDLKQIIKLDVNHISAYNLILEKNTKLYLKNYNLIDDDIKDKFINQTLKKHGYIHYEISNYCKNGYHSKHNMTYWNNNEYYGFGVGACGYIKNIRYDNTRSLTHYLKGNYILNKNKLSINETLQNEFILGFRKIKGINKKEFYKKYNLDIHQITIINDLLKQKLILEKNNYIYINPKYIYISNEILINFINKLYTNKSL